MGILFVLALYAVAFSVAAAVGSAALVTACSLLTREAQDGRKRAMLASALFPFACVLFAAMWFVLYAIINTAVLNRDPGLGDSWNTPLPNGYAINMIDVTDEGTVYNPRTQPNSGSIGSQDDAVFGVRQLQISGDLIFGAQDTHYFERMGQSSDSVDSYFELDTARKTRAEFKSFEQLQQRAASQGVKLKLKNIEAVYSEYRFTWFDYLAGAILFLVPVLGFGLLARFVWKIRTSRRTSPLIEGAGA